MYIYKRKRTIQQELETAYEYNDIGSCAACGDDAYVCIYKHTKIYEFACHNESCAHHWPPYRSSDRSDMPGWFVEYRL